MRILVSGIPGAGKTTVINDVLNSLYKKQDWQDIIRYSDTQLDDEENHVINHISSETFLNWKCSSEFQYNRDIVFAETFDDRFDYIVEYVYGDRPAPEHAAFFDVVLNVSQFNYDKKFITVTKNRYGKAGQLLSFEFVKNDDCEMSIKITERKYVE
nr:MAG TPA: Guanylate kinase [Caudoviricetes sp.]